MLARHLGVSDSQLTEWLTGKSVPPVDIILKAVDPLIRQPGPKPPSQHADKPG